MSETSPAPGTAKISTFVWMIALIVLALSLIALAVAVTTFASGKDITATGFFLVIGLIALTLSAYVLLQSRRRVASTKTEVPQVMTTIECRKCGSKSTRGFQRGDYVFKEVGPCQKCPDDKMIITAIYREVKEKEKVFPV